MNSVFFQKGRDGIIKGHKAPISRSDQRSLSQVSYFWQHIKLTKIFIKWMDFITLWIGNQKEEIIKVLIYYAESTSGVILMCVIEGKWHLFLIYLKLIVFLTVFVLLFFFSYRKLPLSLQLYWYFCWLSMLSFILTFPMKLTLIWIQMKTSRCNESIITISSAWTRLRRNTQSLNCETVNNAISCSPN